MPQDMEIIGNNKRLSRTKVHTSIGHEKAMSGHFLQKGFFVADPLFCPNMSGG